MSDEKHIDIQVLQDRIARLEADMKLLMEYLRLTVMEGQISGRWIWGPDDNDDD